MPTSMSFDQHLEGFGVALERFADHVEAAGLDASVPPCPGWTALDLIAHQGAVHRWAAGAFRGENLAWEPIEAAARASADPVAWLREGAAALTSTLLSVDDDAEAVTFLHDAPAPRRFWARRQCHETTMHAVDALAAALGRLPQPGETWIGRDLALDGIDELLLGFLPRSKSRLRSPEPVTIAVRLRDADHGFTVRVSDEPPVSTRVDGAPEGDLTIEGTALQVYLALWHRTDDLRDSSIWPLWGSAAVL